MVEVRHVVKVFMALKGIAIVPDTTIIELLEDIGRKNPSSPLDASILLLPVIYDDFLEMLCRLVTSDHWLATDSRPESPIVDQVEERRSVASVHMSMAYEHKVAVASLNNRLTVWLKSI